MEPGKGLGERPKGRFTGRVQGTVRGSGPGRVWGKDLGKSPGKGLEEGFGLAVWDRSGERLRKRSKRKCQY